MRFNLLLFLVCLCISYLITGCSNPDNISPVSNELREKAIQELRSTLHNQPEWVKVHAAEYLLWLDYNQTEVQDVFLKEQQQYGSEPPYRIGIWRVLAQATVEPEKKKVWIEKIINAYQDPDGPDRIHAAETLAKLKVDPLKAAPETTQNILVKDTDILSICALWGISTSNSDSLKKTGRKALLNIIISDDRESISGKKAAAYALRHLKGITVDEWHLLAETALSEPKDSEVQIYILSAAFVTAPVDSAQSETYSKIRQRLLQAKNSNKGARVEMAIALAERGASKNLPVLLSLLNDEDPIIYNEENENVGKDNADVRSAAAYAILRIDRKHEYSLAAGDWLVMAAYLLGMLGIGLYYSRKNKSETDFFLGGGKMNPIAVGMSLFATILSSLTYLSLPGEIIKYGPIILTSMLSFPLVHYVVGWFLIPKFMNMNVTSAYEILEKKLGISIRLLATFFFLSIRFLWMATIIYVTVEIAILSIFNIDPKHTLIVSAILMIITIAYTSMGGLKAVVFTDVIQSIVLIGGAVLTLIVVSVYFNSITLWIPDHWLNHWSELKFGFDAQERLTVANAVLSVFIWQLCSAGSDQMTIQRFLATENIQSARKTFGVSLITNSIAQILLGLVGLALIAYFVANPQYLSDESNLNDQADMLFPKFILVGFPVGISGLVAAGIFAAAMSSLSSGLNSASSVISEDIIKRFSFKFSKHSDELKQIQRLSFFVGILSFLLSIGVSYVEGNLFDVIIKVVNLFVAPLFVLFFLALFIPFSTAVGTFIGGIFSVIVAIAIAFFGFLGIGVLFIMPASLFTGIIIGALCSFIDHKFFR